jgi:hypothetical protein
MKNLRRIVAGGISAKEAEELVDTVDRERMAFIKHYFNADWPTRSLYHLMVNTVVGDEQVIATILNTIRQLQESSGANDLASAALPEVVSEALPNGDRSLRGRAAVLRAYVVARPHRPNRHAVTPAVHPFNNQIANHAHEFPDESPLCPRGPCSLISAHSARASVSRS